MRGAVLAVLALGTAAAVYVAFHRHAIPVGALFLAAISLVFGAGVAFVQLRHVALAVVVALAPLPGMIAAAPLAASLTLQTLLAIYGFGSLLASCLAGDAARDVLEGRDAPLARPAIPGFATAIAGAAVLVGWLFRREMALGAGAAVEIVAAALSCLLFVPLTASLLPYGEAAVTAANRARERWAPFLRAVTRVVEPRWGMSLSGIALVLGVLGWFGMAHSALIAQPALWAATALSLFMIAFAVARDWREGLAATLALAALALLCLWLWGRATGRLTPTAFVEIAAVCLGAYAVMLILVDGRRRYRAMGDESAVARLRALEDLGMAPYFGALGSAAAVAPWILVHGSLAVLAAMFVLAGGAAILIQPALATALESLAPRRRSLGQLYGRG